MSPRVVAWIVARRLRESSPDYVYLSDISSAPIWIGLLRFIACGCAVTRRLESDVIPRGVDISDCLP